jgi:hypothetical protein
MNKPKTQRAFCNEFIHRLTSIKEQTLSYYFNNIQLTPERNKLFQKLSAF